MLKSTLSYKMTDLGDKFGDYFRDFDRHFFAKYLHENFKNWKPKDENKRNIQKFLETKNKSVTQVLLALSTEIM